MRSDALESIIQGAFDGVIVWKALKKLPLRASELNGPDLWKLENILLSCSGLNAPFGLELFFHQ